MTTGDEYCVDNKLVGARARSGNVDEEGTFVPVNMSVRTDTELGVNVDDPLVVVAWVVEGL